MIRAISFLFAIALTGSVFGQAKIPLRFSTAAPPPDFLSRSMQQFKADLEKAAPEFDVQLHYGSSLFRQGTEVPAMQRGNLEMSTMTTFEVAQQVPELGFFNRAYLFRDYAHAYKVLTGPVGKRYADLTASKMGVMVLAPTYLGTRQVSLRAVKDIKGPADLSGLKLRMPGGPDWLLLAQSIGAAPTPMNMPEVYLAMQTGAIDGQENPPTIFRAAKFHEVSKQMVLTSHLVQPKEGEQVMTRRVRFRTLGDVTCTCPVESDADTYEKIVEETIAAKHTERGATRLDDQTSDASMELRKKEGYF